MKLSILALAALTTAAATSSILGRQGHEYLHKRENPAFEQALIQPLPPVKTTDASTSNPPSPDSKSSSIPSTQPKPESSLKSNSKSGLGGGQRWAMTYSPYKGTSTTSTSCKSPSEVSTDIAVIASHGFSTVRIYATDCDHLPNIVSACRIHGLKLIIGVFIGEDGIGEDAFAQVDDIVAYFQGDYASVEAVLIGNEVLFAGSASAETLGAFIGQAKEILQAGGYVGPVGTAEVVEQLTLHADVLRPVLDVVGAQIHPFFGKGGSVAPEEAGTYVEEQIQLVKNRYGEGMEVFNSETGWPKEGRGPGSSVASRENQRVAIRAMMEGRYAGKTVFFSSFDDGWKDDGTGGVEAHFGCAELFE